MKIYPLFLLFYIIFIQDIFCQYDSKYWNYRERFRKYFTVVGSGSGESIVCDRRNGKDGGDYSSGSSGMKFGDQTTNLGDYIAMLAMEYKILNAEGQNVKSRSNIIILCLENFHTTFLYCF